MRVRAAKRLHDALIQGNLIGHRIEMEKRINLLILKLVNPSPIALFLIERSAPNELRASPNARYLRVAAWLNDCAWTPLWVLKTVCFLLIRKLEQNV